MSAKVAIAANYFPAYARIPRKAQRKADEFIRKFQFDPKQASIHYEPIGGASDKQLRSVRVGDDYRAIVRAPEQGDLFILLYIDHHDEAYRWAEGKQLQVHPATGTLQFFDVDEASAAVTSAQSEEATESGDFVERRLFSDYSDQQLFIGGVPQALLPAVRALYTDADLDRLVPHIPREAADLLTGLAAGYEYVELLEQILDRLTAPTPKSETEATTRPRSEPPVVQATGEAVQKAVPPATVAVDTQDLEAAIRKESSQAQFRMLDEDFDLEKALSHPLDVWRVYLHPSQKKIVRARTKGPLRITGGAGTGKTVVAMHRAAYLLRRVFTAPDDRILVTTFTKNLARDIFRNLETLLEPEDLTRVEVTNIDAWAADYLKRQGHPMRLATRKERDEAWRSAFDLYGVDGFDLHFCRAEWEAVIQSQGIADEKSYVRAVRHHRGSPLPRANRRKLWELFSEYRNALQASGAYEANDIVRAARQRLADSKDPSRYRSVVVDETQDLSAEALRLVRTIAGPEHPDDLLLVGDAHQRIYGRPAPLSDAGINIRGRRSRELRLNYRTTAAICRWSLGTLGGGEFDDLDGGKSTTRGYVSLRQGAAPVVQHFDNRAEERGFIVGQVKQLLESGALPEEICIVARTKAILESVYAPALDAAGIDCELLERDNPRSASVRLATMHRVKGLEFPIVFVAAVNDGLVPLSTNDLRSEDPLVAAQAEKQERCLLYVATSRARDQLFVTSYESQSPFVASIGVAPPKVAPATPVKPKATGAADPPATAVPQPAMQEPKQTAEAPPASVPASPQVAAESATERAGTVDQAQTPRGPGFGNPQWPPLVTQNMPLISALVPESEANPELAAPLWIDKPPSPATVKPSPSIPEPRSAEVRTFELPEFADWRLPTRMQNWLARRGVRTIEQLSALNPSELLGERNLGRKTIAETATIIEEKLGSSWEELSEQAAPQRAAEAFEQEAPELAPILAMTLRELELPQAVLDWANSVQVNTLRDLASRHPLELLNDAALDRKSVALVRTVLEARLGRRWEEAQRQLSVGALDGSLRWDDLKHALPEVILAHSLGEVALPTRMRTYAAREGLNTVGELVQLRQAVLAAESNLGRTSISKSARVLVDYSETAEQRLRKWEPGLLPALKEMFSELDTVPRMILSRRAGLGNAPETLEEIGTTLGVSRERIRQIEKKTWDEFGRSSTWCQFVRDKCEAIAPDGAAPLDELEKHPWWTALSDEPDALDYFCDRLLGGAWRVVQVGDERYLAATSQKELDKARTAAFRAAKALALPLPLVQVKEAVAGPSTSLGLALRRLIWDEVEEQLAVDGEGEAQRAVAFGSSKSSQVLAFLERQPEPVPVGDLLDAVGRCVLPEEVFHFARGIVGLEKHFPQFQQWRQKVLPVAIQLIEENGPERQWSCVDLLPGVREELPLPDWFGHWHLATILRRGEGIEYLGRLRVALPGVIEDSTRIHVHEAARGILEAAGEPISWERLASQLRSKLDVSDIALVGLLNRPPFLKVKKRTFGLFSRDLPGGVEAMAEALDELEAVLERRQRGLSAKFVHKEIAKLSSVHSQWTVEMALAVVRSDSRFRLTISGNVGLATWDSVRVPSRADIVQEALRRAEGRVSLAAIQDRIEALYGSRPERIHLGQMANRFGARLDGDDIVTSGC